MSAFPRLGSIEEQAARHFLRLVEPDVTPEEIDAALTWKDESALHRDAFERVAAAWKAADTLPVATVVTRQPSLSWSAGSRRIWGLRVAAVVLVAILGAGYGKLGTVFGPSHVPLTAKTTHVTGSVAESAGPTTYTTGRGENRSIDLSDGSRVDLGAASTISVDFAPEVRRVTLLTGEALFHVSKDPSRPFVVDSGGGETQAIGTVFDVHRQLEDVTVSVVEGIVRVQSELPASASTQLMAGHEVSYSMSGKIGAIKKASVPTTASWREGELAFVDRNLSDVVADLNRYSSKPIVLANDDLRSLRITGMVQVDQMQGWLRALEKNMPVRVQATADKIVLLDRPQN